MTDHDSLLHGLNQAQTAAVAAPDASCMVLAGAGSGKTRVLMHRIAWLNRHFSVPLSGIVAVTFTNKAAAEMRERATGLLGGTRGLWVGTFHSIAHRILRTHAADAGLPEAFQVMDADDQLKQVKSIAQETSLDETRFPPRSLVAWINAQKDEGLDPDAAPARTRDEAVLKQVYRTYQTRCNRAGLVDFGELLLRVRNLFRDCIPIRDRYRQQFAHLLVDEFQDTNAIQYDWVRLWAGDSGRVFAVGDVDQCLLPGTPVTTPDRGPVPIEMLRPNDRVCTRSGPTGDHRVLSTTQTWHDGEAVVLRTDDHRILAATPDHTHLTDRCPTGFPRQAATVMDLVLGGGKRDGGTSHSLRVWTNDEGRAQCLRESGFELEHEQGGWGTAQQCSSFDLIWRQAQQLLGPDTALNVSACLLGSQAEPITLWPTAARDVRPGDRVMVEHGDLVCIESTSLQPYRGVVHDIDVESAHHFVAHGLITHNCIYGWRGSRAENVQRFLDEFPQATLFRLEQNYRSTQTILNAANEIIRHNPNRIDKNLWTEGEEGESIRVYTAVNEQDEARWVIQRIDAGIRQGASPQDFAILYRSNAQSRVFEEALISRRLPYRITGGLRFFERAEIKDALAYLRLVAAHHDDVAFERIVNVPARGLGYKTTDALRTRARRDGTSLWDASLALLAEGQLPNRAATPLRAFLGDIDQWSRNERKKPFAEAVAAIVSASGLRDHHSKEGKTDGGPDRYARVENLDELVSVAARFVLPPEDRDAGLDPWLSFLTHAALEAGEKRSQEGPCVELMTLHAAKGLEFPHVFLVGWEEGLFPSSRAEQDGRVEEERRLAYVGLTRAERTVTIAHATERRLYGDWTRYPVSRFLKDIPRSLVRPERSGGSAVAPIPSPQPHRPTWKPPMTGAGVKRGLLRKGDLVTHPEHGLGVVAVLEQPGKPGTIQVAFRRLGLQWVLQSHLQPA